MKALLSIICFIGVVAGLILIVTEVPETATIGTIIKINGGGALLLGVSLLILSLLNKEEKGDEYYG